MYIDANTSTSKKKLVLLVLLIITILGFFGSVLYLSQQSNTKQDIATHASTLSGSNVLSWKSYRQTVSENRIDTSGKILVMNYEYSDSTKSFNITNLKIQNGFSTESYSKDNSYTAQLLNSNSVVVDRISFNVSNLFIDEVVKDKSVAANNLKLTLNIPWNTVARKLRILAPNGTVVAEKDLANIQTLNNTPNFYTTTKTTDKVIKKNPIKRNNGVINNSVTNGSSMNSVSSNDGYYDITFISDLYTADQMNLYHEDVNAAIAFLTNLEPYKSRKTQLRFNYVDNFSPLHCENQTAPCHPQTVIDKVNEYGANFDTIYLMVNKQQGLGGYAYPTYHVVVGGRYGNGPQGGPGVAAHELGHAIGLLSDEYVFSGNSSGVLDGTCLNTTPPSSNPVWQQLVSKYDYVQGCGSANSYRTSRWSVMGASEFANEPYYNALHQKMINDVLDSYVGKLNDTVSPTISLLEPTASTLSWLEPVKIAASDNLGVGRVEYWIDDILFHTEYVSPYRFNWPTYYETNGIHTLQLKAYDSDGNVGVSNKQQFNVSNTTPYQRPGYGGYQVSGQVLNVGATTPSSCPTNGYEALNGVEVELKGNGIYRAEITRVGRSQQPGAFYIYNVPNGSYEVCIHSLPTGKNNICALPEANSNGCAKIQVNNADLGGIRLVVGEGQIFTPTPTKPVTPTSTPVPPTSTPMPSVAITQCKGENQICGTNSECCGGFSCNETSRGKMCKKSTNIVVTPTPIRPTSPSQCKGENQICGTNSECCGGFSCNETSRGKMCKKSSNTPTTVTQPTSAPSNQKYQYGCNNNCASPYWGGIYSSEAKCESNC